jgi:hypothetical protein
MEYFMLTLNRDVKDIAMDLLINSQHICDSLTLDIANRIAGYTEDCDSTILRSLAMNFNQCDWLKREYLNMDVWHKTNSQLLAEKRQFIQHLCDNE